MILIKVLTHEYIYAFELFKEEMKYDRERENSNWQSIEQRLMIIYNVKTYTLTHMRADRQHLEENCKIGIMRFKIIKLKSVKLN
jgi:hypothetical protein